jgi:hypothetical protein
MNGCEGFEIAVEMRLHGAADRQASDRLDAHLATCEACRQFEMEVKTSEKTMRERGGMLEGAFDDARLRTSIRRAMNQHWRAPLVFAAALSSILAIFAIAFWLEKGHVAYSNLRSMIFLFAFVSALVLLRSIQTVLGLWWSQRHKENLLPVLRRDVTRRIRATLFACLVMGALALFHLALWLVSSFSPLADLTWKAWPAFLLLGCLIGGALYGFRVALPRLRRERAELA